MKKFDLFSFFTTISLILLFYVVVIHLRFVVLPVLFLVFGFISYAWNGRKALLLFLFLLPLVNSTPDLFFNGYPFNYMAIPLFHLSGILAASRLKKEKPVNTFPGRGPYQLFLALLGVSVCFVFLRWSNLGLPSLAFLRDTPVAPSLERVSFACIFPVVTLALFSLAPFLAFLVRYWDLKEGEIFIPLKAGFCLSFLLALVQKWIDPGLLAQSWWELKNRQVNGGFSDFNAFGFFAGVMFLYQAVRLIDRLQLKKMNVGEGEAAAGSVRWRVLGGKAILADALFLIVALAAVYISGCRTAFLFVLFAVIYLVFSKRTNFLAKALIMLLLVLSLFFAGGTLKKRLKDTVVQTSRVSAAADLNQAISEVSSGRLAMFSDSRRMISRFPLSGVGAGNFLFYLKYLRFGEDAYLDLPLNQYLLFFSETGLAGGLAFLFFMAVLFRRQKPGGVRFVLAAMAIALLFNNYFWFPEVLLLFWIFIARAEWVARPSPGKWAAWGAVAVLTIFIAANVSGFMALHPLTWARDTATPYDYGFSYPENENGSRFRWTGAQAGSYIYLDRDGRGAGLNLACGAPLSRLPGRRQEVDTYWRGKLLAKTVFFKNDNPMLRIEDNGHRDGFLEFRVRPTFNLKKMGLGTESRDLGIKIIDSVNEQLNYVRVDYTYHGVLKQQSFHGNGSFAFDPGTTYDIRIWPARHVGTPKFLYKVYNHPGSGYSKQYESSAYGRYFGPISDVGTLICGIDMSHGGPSLAITAIAAEIEAVSPPYTPAGPSAGLISTRCEFSPAGSTSNWGNPAQYKFDWGDGSDSGWLASRTTSVSHNWSAAGTYEVRAMARIGVHPTVKSAWSATHAVIIYDGGSGAYYNSPAQYKVLPEVIWAQAVGNGTWMSEVQVTDVSGGSRVSVFYNTATGRRGPFLLWDNSSGGAFSSMKYANLLEAIDGLDGGAFTYYGTLGAVEFISQDNSHLLQAAVRTLNGNTSKTFSALSLHDANTAVIGRTMIIPNLTNNASYRSSCGFFNPTADAVTMELKLLNASNTQVGSTISRTLGGYGFTAFSPFTEAGVPYPGSSYDNIALKVMPTAGTGKVVCFGASANNASNDPAAHVAVQNGNGPDNGPGSRQILPEAIWAPATGGGTWMSEVQVVDVSGGSTISVTFDYGGGNRRGPFVLSSGGMAGTKQKYANILQQLGTIDTGFTNYGKVGTMEFATQDGSHFVQVTARTLNGNYSKTFPGLNLVDAETADTSRVMLVQNYTNNSTYRSSCGLFNPTADALTVEFTLLDNNGGQVGTQFSKTFVGYDFQAFSPFTEAGVPYPADSYDNVILRVRSTSGTGKLVCFGASANNASNDPASHLAVQGQ